MTGAASAARLAVCALAALVWLVAAGEARAEDGSATQETAAEVATGLLDDGTTPAEQGPVEQQPVAEQPVEPAPVEPVPDPATEPVVQPEPSSPQEPAPPVSEAPPPEPPAPEPVVVVEPAPAPTEPPVVVPPPVDLVPAPLVPAAEPVPVDNQTTGPRNESIFTIGGDVPRPSPPPFFSSPGSGLDAVTWAGDRVASSGSRSESRQEGSPLADRTGDAPLLPPLPLRDGAQSGFYASAGGAGSGSSGGFVPLVLAALVALFAAASQRPGGLVSLALAPPRCTAFVLCLERPD